jgi:Fur family ferric uptake transcriptional regulator
MDSRQHFEAALQAKGIRKSIRRMQVVDVFLQCERHVTMNELVSLVHKKYPAIGIATIYRTIKLIKETNIGREIELADGTIAYEHDYGHEHHDHLLCNRCGTVIEIQNTIIENEQKNIAARYGFTLSSHKMVLYGLCSKCMKRKRA